MYIDRTWRPPTVRGDVGAASHSSGRVDNTASGRINDTASSRVDDGQGDKGVTIAKDSKKVTAGLKGAAARKAKQEAVFEQLRKAKDGLRADPQEHHAPAAAEGDDTTSQSN